MRVLVSIAVFLLCFVYNLYASNDTSGFKRYYYPSGAVSSEGFLLQGKPNGYWKTFYENGILKSEGNRKNFQLDSLWKFYSPEGKLLNIISYGNGKKNGIKQVFDPDSGKIISEEPFVNDQKEGIGKYYKNGYLYKGIPFNSGREEGKGYEYAKDSTIITITLYKNSFVQREERINRKDQSGKKQGNWKTFYPTGLIWTECKYLNDKPDGYYKEYSPKGELLKVIKYVNGEIQKNAPEMITMDTRNEFYENGKVKSSGTYKQGIAEGLTKYYDDKGNITGAKIFRSGQMASEGVIDEKGLQQGIWKEFYPTGELKSQGAYINGKKTGKWMYYFQNGKTEQTGSYNKNGKPEGNWVWYYETGNILREETFINGLPEGEMREYTDSGKVITRGMFMDGDKEGFWFLEEGDEKQEGNYKAGQKTGEWKWYYKNGRLAYEGEYVENLENGKHTMYYENGRVMQEGPYIMGQKDGKWRKYDTDGTLLYTSEYKNDTEVRFNGNKLPFQEAIEEK